MEMLYKSAYQHLHISTLQYLQHHYMVQDLSVSVSPCKPSSTIVNHESLSTILPRPIAMHCSYYLTLVCPLLKMWVETISTSKRCCRWNLFIFPPVTLSFHELFCQSGEVKYLNQPLGLLGEKKTKLSRSCDLMIY